MNKNETLKKIRELGLLAVLRGPSPELTVKMVDALGAGSNLCPTAWAKEGRVDDITTRAKEFCTAVEEARS